MIEPQIKRGTTRDEHTRQTRVVWRLYYFTHETWTLPATWTCDTRAEARWFAFTHQWTRIAGAMFGVPEREVGRLIVEGEVLVSTTPGATRVADSAPAAVRALVSEPADAARIARPVMRLAEQETFVALYLTVRNTLIGEPRVVAIGTLNGVEVHPRDVFRGAIAANAASVVVLHNHPSGDPTPSAEDVALTRRLKACGDLLGIPVVDHVVVTAESFVSIAEMTVLTSR